MRTSAVWAQARTIALMAAAIVVIGVIVWLDIATGIWNELVILSGLAAGLVTFLLTAIVLDRIIARSTARRWAPVNRLALSEFLHAIADEEHSEISRGRVVARALPRIPGGTEPEAGLRALHELREQIVDERTRLADVLSRWAHFLASSGDNETVLRHIADIALQLDRVRDASLELEEAPSDDGFGELDVLTQQCNQSLRALEAELRTRLLDGERRPR